MSTEPLLDRIPKEALDAFLDGILSELRSPPDPAMLTKVRSIFRKRIPLHMRSYAASLLILRAAGITRSSPQKQPLPAAVSSRRFGAASAPRAGASVPAAAAAPTAAKKTAEGMVPLFVSMGKRQRLRPMELKAFIGEKSGLSAEQLGRIHLFDNYSFIDVPEAQAEKIIAACGNSLFKNRVIEIKPAKKRGEQGPAKEADE